MRYILARLGTTFATRPRGAEVREDLLRQVALLDQSEPMVIDFTGVHLISFSFADELVGRLLSGRTTGDIGERFVLLCYANEDVQAPIVQSLQRRDLIAVHVSADTTALLNSPLHLQQTFDAAHACGAFRTSDLAADLGLTVQACNNRLHQLMRAGLVSRTEAAQKTGGREYLYRAVDLKGALETGVAEPGLALARR